MLNFRSIICSAVLSAGLLSAAFGAEALPEAFKIKVAPAGGDTLEKALAQVRAWRQNEGRNAPPGEVVIELEKGFFPRSGSLEITRADAGNARHPLVIRGQGQDTRIIGGRMIGLDKFERPADPEILSRLDSRAKNKIITLDLKKYNISSRGPFPDVFEDGGGIFELFADNKRLNVSRWPNSGYTTMGKVLRIGDKKVPGIFTYRDSRHERWLKNPYVYLKGKWRVGWQDPAIKVKKIDPDKKTVEFDAGIFLGIGSKYHRPNGSGKETYCAINLIEEIDLPGEWAIDFADEKLYLYPPEDMKDNQIFISQLKTPLIKITDAPFVRLEKLTLENSLGHGVEIQKADHNSIAGCTIRNVAQNAIVLDGVESSVQSCDLYDLGWGGIILSGGNREKLIPSNNVIDNNHIYRYGVLKNQYSAAVDTMLSKNPSVGMRISHNRIHDAPRDAIIFRGNDLIFEYNDIYYCGYDTADVGAFYSCLDWTIRGVIIRYNYIHDTVGGVNPDDGASGSHAYGNIFQGDRVGVWIASGPDHKIENNIFIKDQGPVFAIDDRGVGRKYATHPRLRKNVSDMTSPADSPWLKRYPEMHGMLDNHPELPWRTKFENNLVVMKSGDLVMNKMNKTNRANSGLLSVKNNYITKRDPGFVDFKNGNLNLRPDAAVFRRIKNFKPVPFDKIGLYPDAYRPVVPPRDMSKNPFKSNKDMNFGT